MYCNVSGVITSNIAIAKSTENNKCCHKQSVNTKNISAD